MKLDDMMDTGPEIPPSIDPSAPKGKGWLGRGGRIAGALLLSVALLLGVAGYWAWQQVNGSLPQLEGSAPLAGLGARVVIERDDLGIPTITGDSRRDVAMVLGFVHAQDRFFQMDLLRRRGAGELSELFGEGAISADRQYRIHRFRDRAQATRLALSAEGRGFFEAYAQGVNEGLAALEAPPFEYLVLGLEPEEWGDVDSILVLYSMYFTLNDANGSRESTRGVLRDVLGQEMYEFLDPRGTEWDAPVVGETFSTPPVPGPEVLDLRSSKPDSESEAAAEMTPVEELSGIIIGSNNWAVAGSHTAHGRALMANDMHLGLTVPHIWYRASMVFADRNEPGRQRRITGITLPGAPFLIAGSNGQIAWGYTNSQGDWTDLVVLEEDPESEGRYLTPSGSLPVDRYAEIIRVRGGPDQNLTVDETIWGPILGRDHLGRRRALRWIAHDAEGANANLRLLEDATTVDEAVRIAATIGIPPENFVVADAHGRIAWTLLGAMPRRFGHDGRLPASWADGSRGWDGWLSPDEHPRLLDPPLGRVWSANNRVVDGEMLARIGDGGFALGARAQQIRDDLLDVEKVAEEDLFEIQLDDRALFLQRWQAQLVDVLEPLATDKHGEYAELRQLVSEWGERAAVDSVGYRMVRAYRLNVEKRVFDAITADCEAADDSFDYNLLNQLEGPLWRLVQEQPHHLLPPELDSWQELYQAAIDDTLEYFSEEGTELRDHTWGERNRARIQHPLSAFLPFASELLDMPADRLPGDSFMPRVQSPTHGASERFVVSPGHEEDGIFHMPGGASGHPLSPYYRAGHEAWVKGEPTPFLPGATVHTLELVPTSQ